MSFKISHLAGWVSAVLLCSAGLSTAAVVSDDFNSCALNTPLWTVVDPIGSSTVTLTGVGTSNAYAVISIPAGASHDLWAGYNDSVRIMQNTGNSDFEVQLKFDSLLNATYQSQGLLVEQDAGTFIRYEVYREGSSLYLFCATISGSSAVIRREAAITNASPIYLSLARTGNTWSPRYSYNGSTWTSSPSFSFTMTVARMGPFAANYSTGTAPATTVQCDYFLNTAAPFAQEDGPLTGYTLTRNVTGQGSIVADPDRPNYVCGDTVTLTAVPAADWAFQNWSGDLSGSNPVATLNMTAARSVTAIFVSQGSPPPLQIANVVVTPAQNSAVINWTTNNPATSSVAYGLTTNHELGSVTETSAVTSHSVSIGSLQAGTQYHYVIACQDTYSGSANTSDATFTTASPPSGNFVSDDFSSNNINTSIWTIVNPKNDASFQAVGTGTADARAQISMPAGVEHEVWTSGIHTPWLKQQVTNGDFGIEAKFDSTIAGRWQSQGLLFQESASKYLRTDFYSEGSVVYLYAAAFNGSAVTQFANRSIPAGAPYYLRVTRTSNQWTVQYSKNGSTWTTGASFQQTLNVTGIGPFASNEGSPAPAFTGLIDYVFNTAQPISPEDNQTPPADTTPPALLSVQTTPYQTSIGITWNTDEPASSMVKYGLTTAYELGTLTDAAFKTNHLVTINGLTANTTYNLRIIATDQAGNSSQSSNLTVTTQSTPTGGPTVEVWYGDRQEFNRIGTPLPAINVLGNAYSSDGLNSLTYSLNGGTAHALSRGPDTKRLAELGDFNIDIPVSSLLPGDNQVVITARDSLGHQTNRTVTVVNSAGPVWPLPYSINWSTAAQITDVAAITDGLWAFDADGVRPVAIDYDRLIAIGDRTWTNYQATVPVTVFALNPNGYAPPSYGPGVGLLLRWPGHAQDGSQPAQGIYPLGAIPMYRWTSSYERFEVFGNNGYIIAQSNTGEKLQLGVTYIFKARVQTNAGRSYYYFKWWRSGQAEPASWLLTGSQTSDPGSGCLLLLAHEADVRFGNVLIEP